MSTTVPMSNGTKYLISVLHPDVKKSLLTISTVLITVKEKYTVF